MVSGTRFDPIVCINHSCGHGLGRRLGKYVVRTS
jgi:hypothetical protein